MVIDFHTHIFPARIAERTAQALAESGNITPYILPEAEALFDSMARAGIDQSVTLPVCTRPDGADKLNRSLIEGLQRSAGQGLIPFGAIHPDTPDIPGQLRLLKAHGIRGVKLHPAFQQCDLDDPRMLRLIGQISDSGLITVCHGGMDVSYPRHNYASVPMILTVLREVCPRRLVMAHMGAWGCWNRVLQ